MIKSKKLLALTMAAFMAFGAVIPANAAEADTDETHIVETETDETQILETETNETEVESDDSESSNLSEAVSSEDLSDVPKKDIDLNSLLPTETAIKNMLSNLPQTYDSISEEYMIIWLQELYLVNKLRVAVYDTDPLALHDAATSAAMLRAEELTIRFDHVRPDGSDCFSILDQMNIPYDAAGENIARNFGSTIDVVNAWYNSPGHRMNMLNPTFTNIGVGIDYNNGFPTWAQLFIGREDIASVEISQLENYNVGQSLEEQGLVVVFHHTDGTISLLPVIDEMVSGFNPNKEGKQEIKIRAPHGSVTTTINVKDQVKAFVSRLYTEILGRKADAEGLKSWSEVLRSKKEQGAKVAQGFIESHEFKKRNLSDKEYISILYRTFLDRDADGAGLAAWQKELDEGLSRLHVFKGFAESEEFTKICVSYNIERGNVVLTAPMDQNEGVTKFIARCYKLCLGREGDEAGINEWCNQILTGKNTAKQAAHGFIFSNEFKNKNLSDEEYVKTLYRVFMDREADSAGLKSWVKVLKSGKSREHVFNGFADSNEFKKICSKYGIK